MWKARNNNTKRRFGISFMVCELSMKSFERCSFSNVIFELHSFAIAFFGTEQRRMLNQNGKEIVTHPHAIQIKCEFNIKNKFDNT